MSSKRFPASMTGGIFSYKRDRDTLTITQDVRELRSRPEFKFTEESRKMLREVIEEELNESRKRSI